MVLWHTRTEFSKLLPMPPLYFKSHWVCFLLHLVLRETSHHFIFKYQFSEKCNATRGLCALKKACLCQKVKFTCWVLTWAESWLLSLQIRPEVLYYTKRRLKILHTDSVRCTQCCELPAWSQKKREHQRCRKHSLSGQNR